MLIFLLAFRLAYAQYTSYNAVAGRLPGRCLPGDFDCGFGRCVSITKFHDGKPDCQDGSDEWCFFGQIKCGAYCVDMSQAFNCLFSSKCDDSNLQPPWCSASKEKICGDPSAFPCKGYGECVLWSWLLDGKKHCIDGSDEDQFYVKTLESSFRCSYNRTKQIAMPPPLNYSKTFLKFVNPTVSPSIRRPLYPTLFPEPQPAFTLPTSFFTPPPSFKLPPPVHLSKVTGLPPLPPPFPTLLPSNPIALVKQPLLVPLSPTKEGTFVPDLLTAPDYPFDYPLLQRTTSSSPRNPLDFPDNFISSEQGSQALFSTTAATDDLPSSSTAESPRGTVIPTKHGYGHIRGRVTETTPSASLTHIRVVAGENEANSFQEKQSIIVGPIRGKLGQKIHGEINDETKKQTPSPTTTSPSGIGILRQSTTAPTTGWTYEVPDEQLVLFPERQGSVNPKFRTTIHPLVDSSAKQQYSSTQPTAERESHILTSLSSSRSETVDDEDEDADLLRIDTTTSATTSNIVKTTDYVKSTTENTCLTDLINTSRNRYPNLECRCPAGEMLMDEHCENHENDLAFYKLDIHSACEENHLTSEEKKWIAIGKIGETMTAPSCIRMSPNGDALVNSLCYPRCNLANLQRALKEQPGTKRSITVEEAALCDDASTNFCHRHALCIVEGVRLKCVCKLGTNDTSGGLGRVCEGNPVDDCIMILGACLIFWLIILLGLLLLIPLIFLLLRCCPRRQNSVHPRKEGIVKSKKKNGGTTEEDTHIAGLLSTLLAKTAGGQRELAMKMALTELELKKEKKHIKSARAVKTSENPDTIVDKHELVPEAVNSKLAQPIPISNGKQTDVMEIMTIPGTVHASSGETPVLDKVIPPNIAISSTTPASTSNVIENVSPPQPSTVTEPSKMSSPLPSVQAVMSVTTSASLPHEMVTSSPVTVSMPLGTVPLPLPLQSLPHHQEPSSPPVNEPPLAPSSQVPNATTVSSNVKVHGNNETTEKDFSSTTSTHSIGVQPTIWESYQALGDLYAKRDIVERKDSTGSLEALIRSRYPNGDVMMTTTSVVEAQIDREHLPKHEMVMSPPVMPAISAKQEEGDRKTVISGAPRSPPTSPRTLRNVKLAEMLRVTQDNSSTPIVPRPAESHSKMHSDEQIVEEISRYGVVLPLTPTNISELPFDEKAAESTSEISLPSEHDTSYSHQSTMPNADITDSNKYKPPRSRVSSRNSTATIDSDKAKQRRGQTSSRNSTATNESDKGRPPRGQISSRVSTVTYASDRVRNPKGQVSSRSSSVTIDSNKVGHLRDKVSSRVSTATKDSGRARHSGSKISPLSTDNHDSGKANNARHQVSSRVSTASEKSEKVMHPGSRISSGVSTPISGSVFVPLKARKQANVKSTTETKPTSRQGFKSRQPLRPPEYRIESTTDESDPEVATFTELAKTEKRREQNLSTRPLRRPERQLSSISEKSAEIAAEAVVQNYQHDYSISAPNTTRSLTQRHRYIPSEMLGGIIGYQTDVDTVYDVEEIQPPTTKPFAELSLQTEKPAPPPRRLWEHLPKSKAFKHDGRQSIPADIAQPTTSAPLTVPHTPSSIEHSALVSSPDIPDVTLRRSLDRLNLLESSPVYSPQREAFTSRSHVRSRKKLKTKADETSKEQVFHHSGLHRHRSSVRKSESEKLPKSGVPLDVEMPHSSRTAHQALIGRKIATRRHETHVTKSTSDLSTGRGRGVSVTKMDAKYRSVDNLYERPKWNSSPCRTDRGLQSDRFRLEKAISRRNQKSQSVMHSPIGSMYRSSSKFSLRSLPMRSSSTIDLSPYFIPGAEPGKPPKEELWWGNVQQSKQEPFRWEPF